MTLLKQIRTALHALEGRLDELDRNKGDDRIHKLNISGFEYVPFIRNNFRREQSRSEHIKYLSIRSVRSFIVSQVCSSYLYDMSQ